MKISRHASLRLSERTKLKNNEFQTILDTFAFVELNDMCDTQFILFYDARGDQFFVAIISKYCVVITILCLWQILLPEIKALAISPRKQRVAELNFYNRAERDLRSTLQVGLNVYISFKNKLNGKVVIPEEYIYRIDRVDFKTFENMEVLKCFTDEISRILVREISVANAHWLVCVTLRRLHGEMVETYSCRIGKIVDLLPLYGVSHDVCLHVRFITEEVKLELGTVAVENSSSPAGILPKFQKQLSQLLAAIQAHYPPSEQIRFKYSIELQNNRLSWSRMFPALSHFELREYANPPHPS